MYIYVCIYICKYNNIYIYIYIYIYICIPIQQYKSFLTASSTLMLAQRQWNQRSQRPHYTQSLYWLPELLRMS